MRIAKEIEIIDLALYLPKQKILIISDLHIGYEEVLNKQGMLVPRFQFKEICQRLMNILKKTKPDVVVINGDLKHEFGTISEQEWRETLKVLDLIHKYCKKIVLIKGNHDTILGLIAKKRKIEIVEDYKIDKILILHGHKLVKTNAETLIIGHEHPAISLRRGIRQEKFKCFLKGKYKRKNLIVMPSFCLVTEGTDIQKEELLSPYLQQNLNDFDVYVVADKIYEFGKIRGLK